MSRFALAIEYLTGYAVATDTAGRENVEWPPHPARVFMALAAAHFETDESPENKKAERAALEWLAALEPPALALPKQALPGFASPRETVGVYVPPNDYELPKKNAAKLKDDEVKKAIRIIPAYRTNKQERFFPRIFVGNEPVRFVWSTDGQSLHLDAIEQLCQKVTRIGHSSSLVWVRLERNADEKSLTHEPAEHSLETQLRVTSEGALSRLQHAFDAEQYPIFSITRGYVPVQPEPRAEIQTPFDPNFIVLVETDDSPQSFGLESTLLLTGALRGLIQKECGIQPVPDWISGHNGPNGPKLANGRGHMALIPLPFVEQQFADGHIMGLGIILPQDVPARDRANALGRILFDENTNEPKILKLTLGRAGEFQVVRQTSLAPKHTLRPSTWTASSHNWISVTPVVLDRMPKMDRIKDREGWNKEVAEIIRLSCINQRLPEPVTVWVEKTPLVIGSLRAMPGQSGFPLLRSGMFQVHAAIEFAEQVQGPLLLGAGRFRGYGLCRPMETEASQ